MPSDVSELYRDCFGAEPHSCEELLAHASARAIFRLTGDQGSCIGVSSDNVAENNAFISFAKSFFDLGIPVPRILQVASDGTCYLLQDLGDETLMDRLVARRSDEEPFPNEVKHLYFRVLDQLPRFQVSAHERIDYSQCYPVKRFGMESVVWDANYFRQEYLDRIGLEYSLAAFELDIERLGKQLVYQQQFFFMYRDFQSRNIMLKDDSPYFIDFQGGRAGPLQYDVVSLLHQSKAQIPWGVREELLYYYLSKLRDYTKFESDLFVEHYRLFVFMRLMQVLGTYGRHGLSGGKEYFRQSIPLALGNLKRCLEEGWLPKGLSELERIFEVLITSQA